MTSQALKDALNRYEVARSNATSVADPAGAGYSVFKAFWNMMEQAEQDIFRELKNLLCDPEDADALDSLVTVFLSRIDRGEFIRNLIWDSRK